MASLSRAYVLPTADHFEQSKQTQVIGGLAPWRERLAKQMIAENLGCRLTVPQLAEACAMSRSHFSRAFKRTTGLSPQEWIHQQRMAQAKQLIANSDKSLTQIGAECGFCDQAHFCRTFLKTEGTNPSTWRSGTAAIQYASM